MSDTFCTGKPDGLYPDPGECTKYISCKDNQEITMICPGCDQNDARCNGSPLMYYDEATQRCGWPTETRCN